ncbi:MAG TPA: DUF2975 domain-containing protein, partial [Telmatospirillum sp.]|nr:DUF2975 domain-containing protein [Telmatospirillum sp.]
HGWVAMAGFKPRPLPPLVATAVFGALSVVSLPALWGLWALKKLFEGFATGAIFTIAAARRLRHCGYALMVAAGLSPIGSMLLSAALSLDLPKNGRSLVISLSTDDLVLLLIGGVLLVVARVMEEAARIAEENAGFV